MKEAIALTVDEVVSDLAGFDDILDARSPLEHAADHLPGALNAPVLDDRERALVGTTYKQDSGFEAKRIGAALVARNIASLLEREFADKPRDWRPLVYCWRGGNRSGSLATVLARIGWSCHVLSGGYKAFRARVIDDLGRLPHRLRYLVVAGRTGSGKSLLLREMHRRGEQVLDLEALAEHRGSVLGAFDDCPQPSQRLFESRLWDAMRRLDPARPVWVESESRRIGTCHQPDALIHSIRQSHCIIVEASRELRVELLLSEYQHFLADPAGLVSRLERLKALHGAEQLATWRTAIDSACWPAFVDSMLERHYDPAYDRSMSSNFTRLGDAPSVRLDDASSAAIAAAATSLIALGKDLLRNSGAPQAHQEPH
jgi:tRNA 2-selenouridine synthase